MSNELVLELVTKLYRGWDPHLCEPLHSPLAGLQAHAAAAVDRQ